jgi:hypothetical protein
MRGIEKPQIFRFFWKNGNAGATQAQRIYHAYRAAHQKNGNDLSDLCNFSRKTFACY